ncbi:hypothetical protein F443_02188 [Phytophthora nicotianae P1569]|uniref:Uncharacterized protein n=1 Tax=Phytophthora nicotianae P1569 TaxID=1317065 RepID=V9FVL6_PHYNI|nr:hypothetical protein F443_02188 [Phytophthora nicotianae P1569]
MKDDGSETESEIGEQDVIVVEDSDTESEDDLNFADIDSEATEVIPDNLFMEIYENALLTRSGRFVVCRNHLGCYVTRQKTREQVTEVIMQRYGAAWADSIPNKL